MSEKFPLKLFEKLFKSVIENFPSQTTTGWNDALSPSLAIDDNHEILPKH